MRNGAYIVCECLGHKKGCQWCDDLGYFYIKHTMVKPKDFDLTTVSFEPVLGLFGYFIVKSKVIGVANIEFNEGSAFVYDMQSFIDDEHGTNMMIDTLKYMEDITEIEGEVDDSLILKWLNRGAMAHPMGYQDDPYQFIWMPSLEQPYWIPDNKWNGMRVI
ncbi:hypothetical protein GLW08_20345 [Pontibacillus yanchengensis]|uniref:Uncharacterized protein n=2 Tax=Pontibacillus yanchengensis TaxID=462910 RepID=A0A6I5A544_9BACI|nr:hypothetical protein [Pontibacillus yanchengensis]MYL35456.1 hypothetical protein [Pontibacillus yanchengensis]MYL55656.1 hypothetical protein [Pontibacillus yanchengensis]